MKDPIYLVDGDAKVARSSPTSAVDAPPAWARASAWHG